jgi:hypothetical protein
MKKARKTAATLAITEPRDWFKIGGAAFGLWALAHTALAAFRYGADQGVYFWFGNLLLIAVAWGLWNKNRGVLISALALACFTEGAWIVDNLSRVFGGSHLLGLTTFLYTPGLPMDEFLLAHHPYFIIPACFFALYFMGKKPSNAVRITSIATPLVLATSYWLFPAARNVNCVHQACVAGLQQWDGLAYTTAFAVTLFGAHLIATAWLEGVFNGLKRTPKRRKIMVESFAGALALACCFSAWDSHYKLTLPALACGPAMENGLVKIGCDYTQASRPGSLIFAYKLQNKTQNAIVCRTQATTQYNAFVLDKAVTLAPGQSRKMGQVLPYPDVSVDVALSAACETTTERAIASEAPSQPARRQDAR